MGSTCCNTELLGWLALALALANQQQQQRPEFYETRWKRTARTAEKKVVEKFLADSFSLSLDANVLRWGIRHGHHSVGYESSITDE
ncbi:hypothetical protein DAPPUDRAFT_235909 [Daphnia pulex]|uniref:Secreted protein n=1 Tax=Daphnia pulex TaxID=6669 RepID=E9FZD5_DAPPU|nr:hypothetical protein DAPPUDRAFT_235909 [Daphnia pulex]|eukprot:EFX87281.1 hypothetical protein DAPPUDRAFT_235909 [Daphnia pulex]